jgi:signal recognition particle GTPase
MAKGDDFIFDDTRKILINDDIIVRAVQEIYSDQVKEIIKKKLQENPRLENELKDAIKDYVKGKLLEAAAQGKMLKVVAELGLISMPDSFRDEIIKAILKSLGPEIDTILKNTL